MARREVSRYNPIDLEDDIAVGIALPFSGHGGRQFHLNYTTEDQAVSNLKNLLLTKQGERYMQPNFGSQLHELLFEQLGPELLKRIELSLRDDIGFWCPYITLTTVSVTEDMDAPTGIHGHGINIDIQFKVDPSETFRSVTFTFSGNGEISVV